VGKTFVVNVESCKLQVENSMLQVRTSGVKDLKCSDVGCRVEYLPDDIHGFIAIILSIKLAVLFT
jgi:hypothetical protein